MTKPAGTLIKRWAKSDQTLGCHEVTFKPLRFVSHLRLGATPIPGETREGNIPLYYLEVWLNLEYRPRPWKASQDSLTLELLKIARV